MSEAGPQLPSVSSPSPGHGAWGQEDAQETWGVEDQGRWHGQAGRVVNRVDQAAPGWES